LPFFLRPLFLTQGTILLEGREDPGGKGANLEQTSANLVREGSAIGPGGRTLALAIMIASRARLKSKLIEKGATLPSAPMRSKQVSGSTEVQELPRLRDYAPGTDRVVFWQRDVRKAASGVSKGDTLLTGKPDFVTTKGQCKDVTTTTPHHANSALGAAAASGAGGARGERGGQATKRPGSAARRGPHRRRCHPSTHCR
jgi:hypothetical protein